MKKDITIFIPTYNRPRFLQRAIKYYKQFDLPIVVCDSSLNKTEILESNVTYEHYPQMCYFKKIHLSLKNIDSKYTLVCTDDDFVVEAGLKKCYSFLEENSDYVSVQGHNVYFSSYREKMLWVPYQINGIGLDINKNSAIERMVQLSLPTPVYVDFSLYRTESLIEVYKVINNMNTSIYVLGGVNVQLLTVLEGKHKVLPELYVFREWYHNSSGYDSAKTLVDVANDKETVKEFEYAKQVLIKHITDRFKASDSIATSSVEKVFDDYFHSNMATREKNLKNKTLLLNKIEEITFKKNFPFFANEKNYSSYKQIIDIVENSLELYPHDRNRVDDVIKRLLANSEVVIFAAGIPGFFIEALLQKFRPDIKINFFIDDFIRGEYDNIEIISLEDKRLDKEMIILVAPTLFTETITKRLETKGFRNYLIVNRMIFDF